MSEFGSALDMCLCSYPAVREIARKNNKTVIEVAKSFRDKGYTSHKINRTQANQLANSLGLQT